MNRAEFLVEGDEAAVEHRSLVLGKDKAFCPGRHRHVLDKREGTDTGPGHLPDKCSVCYPVEIFPCGCYRAAEENIPGHEP